MRVVGIKTLKNRLSEYVRFVRAGETVLVTDRDVVVAEIVPPRPDRVASIGDAQLADAVRRGLVTPPLTAGGVPPRKPVASYDEIAAELDTDRSER
jgi:prevent-host-death family protein